VQGPASGGGGGRRAVSSCTWLSTGGLGLHWPMDLWACGLVGGAYWQGEVEGVGEGFRLGKADRRGRCCRIPMRGKFLQFCKL